MWAICKGNVSNIELVKQIRIAARPFRSIKCAILRNNSIGKLVSSLLFRIVELLTELLGVGVVVVVDVVDEFVWQYK